MKLTPWMLTVATFLIIAALAAGFLFKKLFAAEPQAAAADPTRLVPMATSSVEAGTQVSRSHLGEGPWNRADLTPDTILSMDSLVGRIAKEDIPAATPLRASMFYPIGQGPELDLEPGMRAVSLNVGDSTEMVNGLIQPGDYVDVWMTVDTGSIADSGLSGNDSLSLKLFDGVRTIAINGSFKQTRSERGNTVTLELDKEQQAIMVAAKQKGRITLTANPEGPGTGGLNVEMSEKDRITLRELLGIKRPEEEAKPFITEQYRGDGRRNDAAFDEEGRPWRGNGSSQNNSSLQQAGNNWISSSGDQTAPDDNPTADRSAVSQSAGSSF